MQRSKYNCDLITLLDHANHFAKASPSPSPYWLYAPISRASNGASQLDGVLSSEKLCIKINKNKSWKRMGGLNSPWLTVRNRAKEATAKIEYNKLNKNAIY